MFLPSWIYALTLMVGVLGVLSVNIYIIWQIGFIDWIRFYFLIPVVWIILRKTVGRYLRWVLALFIPQLTAEPNDYLDSYFEHQGTCHVLTILFVLFSILSLMGLSKTV